MALQASRRLARACQDGLRLTSALESLSSPLINGLALDASGEELYSRAEKIRRRILGYARDFGPMCALSRAATLLGIEEVPGDAVESRLRRVFDVAWWRGRVKRALREATEVAWSRVAPLAIHYCSPDAAEQAAADDAATNEWLAAHVATDINTGEMVKLPSREQRAIQQYAELMARSAGIAELAERRGMKPQLITITVPGCMQPITSAGGYRRENQRYAETSPREAQNWLQDRWKRVKRAMARVGFDYEYVLGVQPHVDGSPHWHVVFWTKPQYQSQVQALLRRYFEATEAEGVARYSYGLQFDDVQGGTAGAVAYVSRVVAYISRAVATEGDEEADEAQKASAWAKRHGIRRFRTSHDRVTLYRRLRKSDLSLEGTGLERAAEAAKNGDYASFLIALEEFDVKPAYEGVVGRYGDDYQRVIGVAINGLTVRHTREWKIVPHVQSDDLDSPGRAITEKNQEGVEQRKIGHLDHAAVYHAHAPPPHFPVV